MNVTIKAGGLLVLPKSEFERITRDGNLTVGWRAMVIVYPDDAFPDEIVEEIKAATQA